MNQAGDPQTTRGGRPLRSSFTPYPFMSMTFQSPILNQIANGASTEKTIIEAPQLMELSELDLAAISGGGWFKKLTGISTPSFLKKADDKVREKVPGGWAGVAAGVATLASGGTVTIMF